MAYRVKELFATLQGEGARTGRASVFCRFTGCNLWTGHEEQRASAICQFCDTDFVGTDGPGGGVFDTAAALASAAADTWREGLGAGGTDERRYVVCTGGEPLLQLDEALVDAFHHEGFEIAIETNGTKPVPPGVDWVCVSPKAGAPLVVHHGDELKVVVPQDGLDLDALAELDFDHRFVQPMDGRAGSTEWAVAWCRAHPVWRLSLQTHKFLGIP
jgi:7-carboxy-7-deazaguanine synthase (Cx14CxxC type)